jgi:D-sedoheptulose 7-phosphate isomerase
MTQERTQTLRPDHGEVIQNYVDELTERYPSLSSCAPDIISTAQLMLEMGVRDGKLLVCGNGGSAADADHIVGELMKSFKLQRPLSEACTDEFRRIGGDEGVHIAEHLQEGIQAIALTQHTALNSAFSNDVDPALGFAQQVLVLSAKHDLFLGLSTSGNSKNVMYAAITARAMGIKVISMTGAGGGKLSGLSDVCIRVPEQETYKVQELHLPVYHTLCMIVESCFW